MLTALIDCIRFYSRLPVPVMPFERHPHGLPDFPSIVTMLPLASLIIAAPAALILLAGDVVWSSTVVAALVLITSLLTTGAFHEDGLADVADGLGGGHNVARRLEIMTDSRIGTYGGAALILSLVLRIVLLADLIDESEAEAVALIVLAVAPLSRMAGLMPLMMLANAKPDGKAAAVGRPSMPHYLFAVGMALLLSGGLLTCAQYHWHDILACFVMGFLAVIPLMMLAKKLIGGQTGDVAGAAQQIAEIAMLLTLAAFS